MTNNNNHNSTSSPSSPRSHATTTGASSFCSVPPGDDDVSSSCHNNNNNRSRLQSCFCCRRISWSSNRGSINNSKRTSWLWYAALFLMVVGFILCNIVNSTCRFVEILPSIHSMDENGNNVTTTTPATTTTALFPPMSRGIHRGQLLPSSTCQAWNSYPSENAQLEDDDTTSMVITRVVAALSVVVALFLVAFLVLGVVWRPLSFIARWALVFLSILTAGLQARTRLYVHSDSLCRNVSIPAVPLVVQSEGSTDGNNNVVVYDTCSSDTIAFHLTSATMILYVIAAVLIACDIPSRKVRNHSPQEESESQQQQQQSEGQPNGALNGTGTSTHTATSSTGAADGDNGGGGAAAVITDPQLQSSRPRPVGTTESSLRSYSHPAGTPPALMTTTTISRSKKTKTAAAYPTEKEAPV